MVLRESPEFLLRERSRLAKELADTEHKIIRSLEPLVVSTLKILEPEGKKAWLGTEITTRLNHLYQEDFSPEDVENVLRYLHRSDRARVEQRPGYDMYQKYVLTNPEKEKLISFPPEIKVDTSDDIPF